MAPIDDSDMQERIRRAAEVLKSYGAREVYLFGSAAEGRFGLHSDIDLAVTGLPPEVFFKAMGAAMLILEWSLDLIDLDEASLFTKYLKETGELQRVG